MTFLLPRVVRPLLCRSKAKHWACFIAFSGFLVVAPLPRVQGAVTYEVPRAGAARALRFIDADGQPLQGTFYQPVWEFKGGGLFFTREFGGTRNIWRAFPDPQDSKRYPTWRALPVTNYKAPLFAASAVPIPGARALLVVSNAARANDPTHPAQITRFDLRSSDVKAVTNVEDGAFDPAVSPDGQNLAYAATRGGSTSVYVQGLTGGVPRRIALNARRPTWQDNGTLLLESVGNPTIFRLSLSDATRPLKMSVGEQITVAKDGAFIAFGGGSRSSDTSGQMRIFLMAGDGSGLRAITENSIDARRPALAPDGRNLAFDAPLPGAGEDRAIWVLPLERGVRDAVIPELQLSQQELPHDSSSRRRVVENPQTQTNARFSDTKITRPAAPIAQITGADVASGGALAILGTASGEGATAFLEFGAGTKPANWITVPVDLPLKPGAPLALWTPPANGRGPWTVRLTITNEGGAAQSSFSLRLPIVIKAPDKRIPTPVPATGGNWLPSGGPLPNAPLPNLPVPPPLPTLPLQTYSSELPIKPAPVPPPRLVPQPTPQSTGPQRTLPPLGESPNGQRLPPIFPSPSLLPPVAAVPRVPPSVRPSGERPAVVKTPVEKISPVTPPIKRPALVRSTGSGRDEATFNISGTLAKMAPNQNMKVTFWALNKGDRPWEVGSQGQVNGVVRLVARWVDFDSGNRRKWSMQWMKETVPPGDRASWDFDVTAPPKPGRYKLIYGLVRVPSENWQPPAYDARQESWPNEFAAIAFAVTVK